MPEIRWFKAPPWSHNGSWSSETPGVIYVKSGMPLPETLATIAHETAHHAGADERQAVAYEASRTPQIVRRYGAVEPPALDPQALRLARTHMRRLAARGVEVLA